MFDVRSRQNAELQLYGKTKRADPYLYFIKSLAIMGIFSWHFAYDMLAKKVDFYSLGDVFASIPNTSSLIRQYWIALFAFFSAGNGMAKLFFICSGYGLYIGYLRNPRRTWTEFFKRRAIRLLPIYWVMLLFNFYVVAFVRPDAGVSMATHVKALVYHIFLLHYYSPYVLHFGAFWFVGYIVQLYLVFPLLVPLINSRLRVLYFAGIFAFAVALELILEALAGRYIMHFPTNYLSLFVAGMLMARLSYERGKALHELLAAPWITGISLAACVSSVVLLRYRAYFSHVLIENVAYIGLFVVLAPLTYILQRKTWIVRGAFIVSIASYIVFLSHQPITRMVIDYFDLRERVPPDYLFLVIVALFVVITLPAYYLQVLYDRASGRASSD